MMSQDSESPKRDPDASKRALIEIGLPLILAFIASFGLVINAKYGDTKWYKTIVEADYGNGPYDGRTGMSSADSSNSVENSGQTGAFVASGVDASQHDPTYQDVIFGSTVTCVDINTDRWFPGYFEPDKAEVETAWQAMNALELMGVLDEDKVIVRQGGSIRIVSIGSPELDHLANRTSICVP